MPICLAESSLPYPISDSIKAPICDLEKIGVEKQIKHVFYTFCTMFLAYYLEFFS